MAAHVKKRFTHAEDVLILREITATLPFMAKHGSVMDAWNAVAQAVSSHDEFVRVAFDGKRAQNRFLLLMENHRAAENDPDVAEERERLDEKTKLMDERAHLLDQLAATYQDWKAKNAARLVDAQREADQVDSIGVTVEALQSLGKRKAPADVDDADSTSDVAKLLKVWHDTNAADLEFRKYQYEKDLEERQKVRLIEVEERRRDRDMVRELIRMQHDTTVKLCHAMNSKPQG